MRSISPATGATATAARNQRQAHQWRHNRYTQVGDKPVDYVGTDGGKDVGAAITPGGYPQSAAAAHAFAHRPCGHENGRRPRSTAVVPSFHRPYDYDDSYIYQAVTSKPRAPRGHLPPSSAAARWRHRTATAAAAARPDAHERAQQSQGTGPLTRAAVLPTGRCYPGDSVMTHTESGGGSK
jgi:hypothetical protein